MTTQVQLVTDAGTVGSPGVLTRIWLNPDGAGQSLIGSPGFATRVVLSGPPGVPGPVGSTGATGPPGTPGSAPQNYHHEQGVPSASWTIVHNLGFNPAGIRVFDSGGNEWEGVVTYLDVNSLRIDFDVPFGGEADMS